MKNKKTNPIITTILTSYNRPNLIQDAIKSVLSQTYPYFELIIASDNSNQETENAILKYLVDPRIKYFSTNVKNEDRLKKCRYAVIINMALQEYVTGNFVNYLCDDDVYYSNRFEKVISYFDAHPKADVLYTAIKITEGKFKDNKMVARKSHVLSAGTIPQEKLKNFNWIDQNCLIHRKKCIDLLVEKKEGLWVENPSATRAGDWFFWKKLDKHFKFHFLNEITCEKRKHAKSIQIQQNKKRYNIEAVSELRE